LFKTILVSRTSASRWGDQYRWGEGGINNEVHIVQENERIHGKKGSEAPLVRQRMINTVCGFGMIRSF